MTREERRVLAPSPISVRAGRHFVADVLARWQLDGHLETATLLASEVVANAVVHAGTPCVVDVRLDLDRSEVVVAVTDQGDRPVLSPIEELGLSMVLEDPDLEAESGRGLLMVATLADRWGIEPSPDGNTVWFALALDEAASLDDAASRDHAGSRDDAGSLREAASEQEPST